MATDYAIRDRDASVTFYVLLWKRHGITREMFDDYWRDVHGPVCARLPQHQYWQFHVAPNEGGILPVIKDVASASPDDDQFSGIAELTFRSPQDRERWFREASILMADEHNIFSKAIGYVTSPGNSRTYLDRIEVGAPNGRLGIVKLHVMVKQADGIGVDAFRRYLTGTFATAVAKSDLVLKFRLHLFEPPDVSRPDAAGVTHFEAPDKQYQAAFEIAFNTRLDMEAFFASDAYAAAVTEQAKYLKQVSAFPERDAYTFVYDGKLTLAGQRGSRTAQLITDIGAINQLADDIVDLVVGKGNR